MQVILARHGTAEEQGTKPDPERILVEQGREQANMLGRVLLATLGVPGAIWSSRLRRAMETAKLAAEAMGLHTEPKPLLELCPGGDLASLAWLVQRSGSDLLLLVGHQPDLGTFAGQLLGLPGELSLKKGGLCIIETVDATKPQGRAIATLSPEQYSDLLAGREYAPWMRKQLRI